MIEPTKDGALIRFRLLDLEVRVHTNDPAVAREIDRIAPRAVPAAPAAAGFDLNLIHEGETYRLTAGERGLTERSLAIVSQALIAMACEAMMARHPGAVTISAATLSQDGGVVLLVGAEESGRSTLALALALAGRGVSGDYRALLEGGLAAPFPGRFSVWSESLKLLAAAAGAGAHAVLHSDAAEHARVPIDPIDLGQPCQVEPGPVSAVILLEPNFGGRSRLRQIGASEMSRLVLQQCAPPGVGGALWVGEVCQMVASARIAVLELGTLETAVDTVTMFLDRRLRAAG